MMKSRTLLINLSLWMLIGACALVGCETMESEPSSQEAAGADQSSNKPDQTQTPPTTTNPPNPNVPTNTTSLPAGRQVPGATVDVSRESDNRNNDTMWVGGESKVNVRCLANDSKTKGMGDDYFCGDIVTETEALIMAVNGDGTVTAIASDFVSPRSGLVYKFQGYTVDVSSGPLIRANPYTLSKGQQKGVFRAYWNTYSK
jgi:hypothetical protein